MYMMISDNVQADFLCRLEHDIPLYRDSDEIDGKCNIAVVNSDRNYVYECNVETDSKNKVGLIKTLSLPKIDPKDNISKLQQQD